MKEDKLKIDMFPCMRTFFLRIKMPAKDLRKLKRYSKDVLNNPKQYTDHSEKLAGRIDKGKQLLLPPDASELQDYYSMLNNAAGMYYRHYLQNIGATHDSYKLKGIQNEESWLNSYYEGDYNPVHYHDTISPIGLSSFTFINTPDCIKNNNKQQSTRGHLSGNKTSRLDGRTVLHWGYSYSGAKYINNLESSQMETIYPEEGVTYLFPCWMAHQVYPFKGKGKRITMGTNISIWNNADWEKTGKSMSTLKHKNT